MDDVYLHNTRSVIRKSPDIKTYIWRVFMSWYRYVCDDVIRHWDCHFGTIAHLLDGGSLQNSYWSFIYKIQCSKCIFMICINLKLVYLCVSIQTAHFLMVSTTSLLQGLKYMIITLDIKIIIIKQEMLEPFQITQSELMGQYIVIHWITMLKSLIQ